LDHAPLLTLRPRLAAITLWTLRPLRPCDGRLERRHAFDLLAEAVDFTVCFVEVVLKAYRVRSKAGHCTNYRD
jgi:hypothetical protein